MEITLADAQAVEDFRLLIKLSCGLSYVQEGDVRLPMTIRLRLAFLANAFEFVDCVQECLQSLSEDELTPEEACSLPNEIPQELWEHDAAMGIRSKIIKVLGEKISELAERSKGAGFEAAELAAAAVMTSKVVKVLVDIIDELGARRKQALTAGNHKKQVLRHVLRQAGEALGKALGPVDRLFGEGLTKRGRPIPSGVGDFYRLLPLRADIKGFSASVMETLLGSEVTGTFFASPGMRSSVRTALNSPMG